MISKLKRNTILAYCMATVVMLCVLASNIFEATTSLKTTKKVVAGNNYVETSETSYGLVAIEASSCIEEKNAQNVTEEKEEKKEESKNEPEKVENKKVSSTSNKTTTAKSNSNNTKSTKTTSNTTKKSNTTTKKSNTTTKKSNTTTSNTSTTTTTTTTGNSDLGVQIANYAKQFNGNPYVYGGTSLTKGADCSGFVQSVYKHFGISLPRRASQQAKVGRQVSWSELQPGDLLFYGNGSATKVAHVAIYIGNGKIIHAQTPKLGIGITTYNIMTKVTARRVI